MAAPADADAEERQRIDESRNVDILRDLEGEQPGVAGKRLLAGMIGIGGVVDPLDLAMRLEPLGEREPALHVMRQSQRQRSQAAQQQPAFEGRELAAERGIGLLVDVLDMRDRAGHHAGDCVAMAA